ncbi:hypothetical protein EJ05DRAFT_68309 [Pseudovirgaria hyperparasitica]|uniref:Uncharacterized protein n=1 Tax=Pseudovirgaria hyperparasitica TaxID=470096 RepID=A0A6A6W1Z6_9PEZI|nr:uncharacterized protein EJ05DRAFT_68309 [Pseudovirgaria hyperparasitica]KAF2756573.1 hypothetical protein EJ05DRAFT_68309 [Pseudovirgaria hyperparasitica]
MDKSMASKKVPAVTVVGMAKDVKDQHMYRCDVVGRGRVPVTTMTRMTEMTMKMGIRRGRSDMAAGAGGWWLVVGGSIVVVVVVMMELERDWW